MQTTTLHLYSLGYTQLKTYLIATAFVVGNILLPQLAHFVPQGGFIFLPIYFFTLIAAYKYGWKVGLLTAVLSPLVNHILFGMPPLPVLPAILIKSVFLAFAAGAAAHYFKRLSLPILAAVILAYQLFGTLVEWALVKDFFVAIQDFRIGIPGMLLQLFGGYSIINYLIRK
ncbi:MAG: ECF transporter S component [Phocaeicola sp.]